MEVELEQEKPAIKINGLTFLEFCDKFTGYEIRNARGKAIPRYLLFWNRISVEYIEHNYKFTERDREPIN